MLLEESRTQCRYFVFFNDDESQFQVYLVCPDTEVYRFKLVKLHVKLSWRFPEVPPKVRFLHHTRHHIRPNFSVNGRLCLGLFKFVNFGCSSFPFCPVLRTARNLLISSHHSADPVQPGSRLLTFLTNRDFNYDTWSTKVGQWGPGMICVRQCLDHNPQLQDMTTRRNETRL